MIRAGIIGVSGYSGGLVLELLLKHNQVRVNYISAHTTQGPIADIWPRLRNTTHLQCEKVNLKKAISNCDVVFLAVPHTQSIQITPQLLKAKKRVIDLSADYRLKDPKDYEKWYDIKHKDAGNLKKAVYGLPELYREAIKKTSLLSNPGCYPTAAILALAPLVSTRAKNIQSIIIDAKSGVSGSGRKVTTNLMFSEVDENFKAYKVLNHQHTPEINLYLSRLSGKKEAVTFITHLLPINRGILETIYVQLKGTTSLKTIAEIYQKFYKTEPFARILPSGIQPEVKSVVGTNYCDIGLALDQTKNLLIITSVIDNLMKGASGQAVQNMNIMFGFKEDEGLI